MIIGGKINTLDSTTTTTRLGKILVNRNISGSTYKRDKNFAIIKIISGSDSEGDREIKITALKNWSILPTIESNIHIKKEINPTIHLHHLEKY